MTTRTSLPYDVARCDAIYEPPGLPATLCCNCARWRFKGPEHCGPRTPHFSPSPLDNLGRCGYFIDMEYSDDN
jgi:hypothetical protein